MAQEGFVVDCFIMGYHDYQAHWIPCENEILPCAMEATNPMDKYAVAVLNFDISITF